MQLFNCVQSKAGMSGSQKIHDSFDERSNLKLQSRPFPTQKRQIDKAGYGNSSESRARDEVSEEPKRCGGPDAVSKFSGFITAGSKREIKVSENALNFARTCLFSTVETFSDEEESRDDYVTSRNPSFSGFVTAGTSKVITISDSALDAAKIRLRTISDDNFPSASKLSDVENLDPRCCVTSNSKRFAPTVSGLDVAYVTPESSRGSSRRMTSKERDVVTKRKDNMASRITCVRDLRNSLLTSVDFLGIVVENAISCQKCLCNTPLLKVADRYGESVSIVVLSNSIPSNIFRGSVISIDGALLRRSEANVLLVINESTFVDLEPNDPEANCLHRLFLTGLFDSGLSEDSFTFDRSTLRVIGRLNEYPREISTVMARICSISSDSLVYLGCTSCKKSVTPTSNGIAFCHHCRNKKARYFYSLSMELADFTGVIVVDISDEAAEKLMKKPAGGMVKLGKTALKMRLLSLCFRPMLFRISEQNSKWLVDDWKQLNIPQFKPFLKNIAEQKGYK